MSSPTVLHHEELKVVEENPAEYSESDSDSSSDDDNDDDYSVKKEPQKVEISVKDQLAHVLRDIKDNGKLFEKFSQDVKDRLADRTGDPREPTTLHILAVKKKEELPKERDLKPLIEFLAKHPGRLLTVTDDDAGLTPLHLAISQKNRTMVRWMCSAYDDIDQVLSIKSHKQKTCLHVAIEKGGRIAHSLVELASPDTLSDKNEEGNTPLHLAVEYKRCDEKQLELIKAIVKKCDHRMREKEGGDFNNLSRSPYLHHLFTCEQAEKDRLEKEKKKKKDDELKRLKEEKELKEAERSGRPPNPKEGGQKGPNPITLGPPAVEEEYHANRPLRRSSTQIDNPSMLKKDTQPGRQQAPPKYGAEEKKAPTINPLTIGRAPDTPISGPGGEKKPLRKKDLVTRGTDTKESSSDNPSFAVDDIRRFLKLHYLRARGHDTALEILYERNSASDQDISERAICFDLSGSLAVTKSGIKKTISILKFEDILQYVDIPKISTPEESNLANTKRSRGPTLKNDSSSSTDLVEVFGWLKGVSTIIKVTVDDLGPPAHSDVAIETALKGKGVEIWDWKKIDLCSEVIREVAPDAREVHLYWSGNNAVLRGWSEKEGLPQLGQLERVELHVQQGLEPLARIKDNVAIFKNRMAKHIARKRTQDMANETANEMTKEIIKEMTKDKEIAKETAKEMAEEIAEDMVKEMIEEMSKQIVKDGIEETAKKMTSEKAKEKALGKAKEVAKEMIRGKADETAKKITKERAKEKAREKAREAARDTAKELAKELATQCRDIKITPYYPEKPREPTDFSVAQNATEHGEQPMKHAWIETMTAFKELLFTAEANSEPKGAQKIAASIKERGQPIVVALIDDGIDVKELQLENHGRITGRSFYPRPHDPNRTIPYYESSGGHGTTMASQIHRICPKAEIYVLKLEDYIDPESKKRQITLKSAAQAIRQAVKKKVHVISMSWTITLPSDSKQSPDVKELEDAIISAAQEGILMFCSASDEGAKQASTYPSAPTPKIFKIGGADANGGLYKPVGDIESVDFILPGKSVEGEETKVEFWTGSSVATALAAGLAALILYCSQIRILRTTTPAQKDKATRDFEGLKQYEKMMGAFRNIGTTRASKNKYLTVWKVFDRNVLERANTNAELIDLVADVATVLARL